MKKTLLVGLPLVFLVGCTSANPTSLPEVVTSKTPVDAETGTGRQYYNSVTRGYNKRQVVEPEKWRDRNAAPKSWRDQSVEPTPQKEPGS